MNSPVTCGSLFTFCRYLNSPGPRGGIFTQWHHLNSPVTCGGIFTYWHHLISSMHEVSPILVTVTWLVNGYQCVPRSRRSLRVLSLLVLFILIQISPNETILVKLFFISNTFSCFPKENPLPPVTLFHWCPSMMTSSWGFVVQIRFTLMSPCMMFLLWM